MTTDLVITVENCEIIPTTNPSVIAEDTPTMLSYLTTIQEQIKEITEFINAFTDKIKDCEYPTKNGISLLDVKYHTLLAYLIDVAAVMHQKISGKSLKNCKALERIVENRTVVEKIRPLEHKLKYQIDKLLTENRHGSLDNNDPLKLKPGLDNLESKIDGDSSGSEDEENNAEDSKTKKYVPPHIAAMQYDEEGGDKKDTKRLKAHEKALQRSSVIAELVNENSEAPMEISEYSGAKKRVYKERKHRTDFEEDNFMRVQLSKKQKYTERKLLQRSELNSITSFGNFSALDESAAGEMLDAAAKRSGGNRRSFGKKKMGAKKYGKRRRK